MNNNGIKDQMNQDKLLYLDKDMAMTLPEYEHIESELLNLLEWEEKPFDLRLIAGAVWLDILRDFLKAAAPPPGGNNQIRREVLDTFMETMKREHYERPFRIAAKPVHSPSLHRMFIGLFVSFRNHPEKRRSNLRTLFFVLSHYALSLFRIGRISMSPLERPFPFSAFRKYPLTIGDPSLAESLHTWAVKFIKEKKLLKTGNVRFGYFHLLLYYALIRWYAAGLAWGKNSSPLAPELISAAIQLTEEHYVFHPCFEELFTYNPVLKDIMDKAFHKKTCPMSLVRSPV